MSKLPAMEPLRLGLLGTSRVNERIVSAAATMPELDVVAIASRDQDRANEQAERLGVDRTFKNYMALLTDCSIDAVYLALPNSLHVEWADRALASGKHVLVEKSLSCDRTAVKALFDHATSKALYVLEGMMFRYHPQTSIVRNLLSKGEIGHLRLIQAHFSYPLAARQAAAGWRPELAGGALMDLGCYCVAASRAFAGDPVKVSAFSQKADTGVDSRVSATLVTGEDVVTRFDVDLGLPKHQELVLHGEEGSIRLESPLPLPSERAVLATRQSSPNSTRHGHCAKRRSIPIRTRIFCPDHTTQTSGSVPRGGGRRPAGHRTPTTQRLRAAIALELGAQYVLEQPRQRVGSRDSRAGVRAN